MIVDLGIAIFIGIRTDSFMHIDIDMPMFIRSKISPLFSVIGLKDMANLIQQRSKIKQKMVQHGAKIGLRTAC